MNQDTALPKLPSFTTGMVLVLAGAATLVLLVVYIVVGSQVFGQHEGEGRDPLSTSSLSFGTGHRVGEGIYYDYPTYLLDEVIAECEEFAEYIPMVKNGSRKTLTAFLDGCVLGWADTVEANAYFE